MGGEGRGRVICGALGKDQMRGVYAGDYPFSASCTSGKSRFEGVVLT